VNLVFARAVVRDASSAAVYLRAPAGPVAGYAAGTIAGGVAAGVAVAGIGRVLVDSLPAAGAWIVVALAVALAAAAIVLELRGRLAPLPQRHAQLPSRWMRWRSRTGLGLAFGLLLGAGVFTYLHHATAYVLGAILVLSASPLVGAIAGAIYGLARAAMLALAWAKREWTGRGDEVVGAIGTVAARLLPFVATGSTIVALAAIHTAPWGA
jgi:hypothetical protein